MAWTCEELQRAYDQASALQKQLIGGSTCEHWQAGYKDLSGWQKRKVDDLVRQANAAGSPGGGTPKKPGNGITYTALEYAGTWFRADVLVPVGVGVVFLWLVLR
jgi:hypothetical protein